MKALSLRQPHASLFFPLALAPGEKPVRYIETRGWTTKYRGRLAIHSAKRTPGFSQVGDYWYGKSATRKDVWVLCKQDGDGADAELEGDIDLPLGVILGTVNLVDVVPIVRPASETGVIPPDRVLIDPGPQFGLRWTEPISSSAHGYKLHPCEDQRSYGDFTPGRYAWIFEDAKRTDEQCPACGIDPAGHSGYITMSRPKPNHGNVLYSCLTCDGKGTCPPIPAKGHPGLWNWETA